MEDFYLEDYRPSGIEVDGNYFIMDSENLVSNPFQQTHTEVVSDFQKKISMTEKLTAVKNNQNEHYFSQVKAQMERDKMHALKLLHENTSRLRYEMKLLDLDKRKNQMELQKRLEPERDFSYDDTQITNSQKRLGANIESFYLNRKMRYPVRIKSVKDIGATPMIRRARQALKGQDVQRRVEDQESVLGERVQTAKTVSSSVTIQPLSREGPLHERRRNSRSAPVMLRSYDSKAKDSSRFPDIKGGVEGSQIQPKSRQTNTHVKFAFHSLTTPGEEGKENLPRAASFVRPGSMRPSVTISDSDEDDDDFPEGKIDLRAILFGKTMDPRDDNMSVKSHALSQATCTTQQSGSHWSPNAARRFASIQPQQLTQEALQAETKAVQNKVDSFLKVLEREKVRLTNGEDSESDHEDIDTTKVMFASSAGLRRTVVERPDSSKLKPKEEVPEENEVDRLNDHGKPKRNRKDAWKYIEGKPKDGRLRGTYNSQDLVLQYLAGPQDGQPQHRSIIPLHSASRALRHTATFKMRKVVETLRKNRTRYEQHEVDLLKIKQGMDVPEGSTESVPNGNDEDSEGSNQ